MAELFGAVEVFRVPLGSGDVPSIAEMAERIESAVSSSTRRSSERCGKVWRSAALARRVGTFWAAAAQARYMAMVAAVGLVVRRLLRSPSPPSRLLLRCTPRSLRLIRVRPPTTEPGDKESI